MGFPAISPVQAIQLGVAAQAAGSVAASAFSDLLRSAAEFLAPEKPCKSCSDSPGAADRLPAAAGGSDLSVLSGQIESLLSQIADRVRTIVSAGGRPFPAEGLTLSQNPAGNVAVAGESAQGPALSPLLQQDGLLRSLFRALDARKRLFDSASPAAEPGAPLRLHVDANGARTVGG